MTRGRRDRGGRGELAVSFRLLRRPPRIPQCLFPQPAPLGIGLVQVFAGFGNVFELVARAVLRCDTTEGNEMRILYGVVGEGMGHATRSKVILEELVAWGHELVVVVSGRAHGFIAKQFANCPRVVVEEIHGLSLDYDNNQLDLAGSVMKNLKTVLPGLAKNLEAYRELAERHFKPEVVISDFESWAYLYGMLHQVPVISVDNMQILDRCRHEAEVTRRSCAAFQLAKLAVKIKLPHAYYYLVTSFFFPPVRKPRTSLVPPILRPVILAARREPGEHVVVYQTAHADDSLAAALKELPAEFRWYGRPGAGGREGNILFQPFSETGFVEDLRTARAVVATGGYSLMGEAVHLGVPLLAKPIRGQYEQELNALYLEKLGYGNLAETLSRENLERFLDSTPVYEARLREFPRQPDNGMLFRCLEELLERIARKAPPPDRLSTPVMGDYQPAENSTQ